MPNALLTGVGRRRGIAAGIAAGLAEGGWDLALSYWHPYDQRVGHGGEPDDPERLADELCGQNWTSGHILGHAAGVWGSRARAFAATKVEHSRLTKQKLFLIK